MNLEESNISNKLFTWSLNEVLTKLCLYIHLFNLASTFYDLFRHTYMSPISLMKELYKEDL